MASTQSSADGQRRKRRPDDNCWCAWRAGDDLDPVAHLRDHRSAGHALCGLELPSETRATSVGGADGTSAVTSGVRWISAAGVERCPECEVAERRLTAIANTGRSILRELAKRENPQRRDAGVFKRLRRHAQPEQVDAAFKTLLRTGRIEERDGKLRLTAAGREMVEADRLRRQRPPATVGRLLDEIENLIGRVPALDPYANSRARAERKDRVGRIAAQLDALLDALLNPKLTERLVEAGRELRCVSRHERAKVEAAHLRRPALDLLLDCGDLCVDCRRDALDELRALRGLLDEASVVHAADDGPELDDAEVAFGDDHDAVDDEPEASGKVGSPRGAPPKGVLRDGDDFTQTEVAAFLGVTPKALRDRWKDEVFPPPKRRDGRQPIWSRASLLAFHAGTWKPDPDALQRAVDDKERLQAEGKLPPGGPRKGGQG